MVDDVAELSVRGRGDTLVAWSTVALTAGCSAKDAEKGKLGSA